jgi:uncharacterized protein YidB (DUF937 family)
MIRLRGGNLASAEHERFAAADESRSEGNERMTSASGDEVRTSLQAYPRCAHLPARVLRHLGHVILPTAIYPPRRRESWTTVSLAHLNDEIAAELNLEPKAGELVQQVTRLIAEQPGGIESFLEKFKASGHEVVAASWHGSTYVPLTVRQVKKLVGTAFIKEVGKYLEVPQGFASKVLGVLLPKIVGLLAAQNVSSDEVSPDARIFLALALGHLRGRVHDRSVSIKGQLPLLRMDVRYLRFIVPTLVITGGLLGYAISPPTANSTAAGLINGANAAAVTCRLASGFETHEITGDFAVGAGWFKNLAAEFDSYDSGNPKGLFAGNTLTVRRASYSTRKIASTRSVRSKIQRKGRSGHEPKS